MNAILLPGPRLRTLAPSAHDSASAADSWTMSISAVSGSHAASSEVERTVAVLKKTKEVEKSTADSLTQLVKDAGPRSDGRIDTYA
jgi:hypothetical protein